MNPRIHSILKQLDLSDKEIAVYLHGVSLPPQHVSSIGKACSLTRSNAYDIIKKLEQKGLCHNLGSLYGRRIKMLSPKELTKLIDRKQRELNELKSALTHELPTLLSKSFSGPFIHPQVQYFNGTESVQQLFEKSLQCNEKQIHTVLSEEGIFDVLGKEFIIDHVKRRVCNQITSVSIRPNETHDAHPIFSNHSVHLREIRYKPKTLDITATILLWDNYVGFITIQKQPFGTLIRSKDFATSMKSWFKVLWDVSSE
jgi:sugar-specific transcriptional regulator TrmB